MLFGSVYCSHALLLQAPHKCHHADVVIERLPLGKGGREAVPHHDVNIKILKAGKPHVGLVAVACWLHLDDNADPRMLYRV